MGGGGGGDETSKSNIADGTDSITNQYLKDAVKSGTRSGVFSDDKVWAQVQYYAKENNKFLRDVPLAYDKVVLAGATYVGGKQATILELDNGKRKK